VISLHSLGVLVEECLRGFTMVLGWQHSMTSLDPINNTVPGGVLYVWDVLKRTQAVLKRWVHFESVPPTCSWC
jgi:hypothetical protein